MLRVLRAFRLRAKQAPDGSGTRRDGIGRKNRIPNTDARPPFLEMAIILYSPQTSQQQAASAPGAV